MSSTNVNSILLFFWGKWWKVILSIFSSYSLRNSLFSSAIWFCSSSPWFKKGRFLFVTHFAISIIFLITHFYDFHCLPSCSIWALYSATISGDIFSLFGSRTRECLKTVPKEQPNMFLMTSMKLAKVRSSGQFWWLQAKVLMRFCPSLQYLVFIVVKVRF